MFYVNLFGVIGTAIGLGEWIDHGGNPAIVAVFVALTLANALFAIDSYERKKT